jgi:hypothetical protein
MFSERRGFFWLEFWQVLEQLGHFNALPYRFSILLSRGGGFDSVDFVQALRLAISPGIADWGALAACEKSPERVREGKVASEPVILITRFGPLGVNLERIGLEAAPLSQWLYAGAAGSGAGGGTAGDAAGEDSIDDAGEDGPQRHAA